MHTFEGTCTFKVQIVLESLCPIFKLIYIYFIQYIQIRFTFEYIHLITLFFYIIMCSTSWSMIHRRVLNFF